MCSALMLLNLQMGTQQPHHKAPGRASVAKQEQPWAGPTTLLQLTFKMGNNPGNSYNMVTEEFDLDRSQQPVLVPSWSYETSLRY